MDGHIAGHDNALRVSADDVDQLPRCVAPAAGYAAKAHGFAKDH